MWGPVAGDIPRAPLKLSSLFSFREWNGLGMLPLLHSVAQILNAVSWIVVILDAIVYGPWGYAILVIVFAPFFWIAFAATIKILCEVAAVILMAPSSMPAAGRSENTSDNLGGWGTSVELGSSAIPSASVV